MPILKHRLLALLLAIVSPGALADPLAAPPNGVNHRRGQAETRSRSAQVEFDGVALQAMIAPMMSGMKSGPLGSGPAGRYWKSLMTEHIARHIAASGQLRLLPALPNASRTSARTTTAGVGHAKSRTFGAVPAADTSWRTMVSPASNRDLAPVEVPSSETRK